MKAHSVLSEAHEHESGGVLLLVMGEITKTYALTSKRLIISGLNVFKLYDLSNILITQSLHYTYIIRHLLERHSLVNVWMRR